MAQYIDKDALVAEIERRKSELGNAFHDNWARGSLDNILSFLNTIEVKDVDLDKEIDDWYQNKASKEFEMVFYDDIEKCAKHFFELGLKAQV